MENNTQLQKISDNTLFKILEPKQNDIVRFMGGQDHFKKEVSFAIQAANANSFLAEASPTSVAKAIYNLAITGLSLNPVTKLAYLIPKRIQGNVEAVLMPSYQGLVKIIVDCGAALSVESRLVYEGDLFVPEYGTNAKITHTPRSSGKGKDIIAVYAVWTLPSGIKISDVMWREEVDEIREYSDSYRSYLKDKAAGKSPKCIWVDWYGEQAKKTVVRRSWKMIPKARGTNYEKVSQTIELMDQDGQADINQLHRIESLLQITAIDPQEIGRIEQEMPDYTFHQAARCIQYLEDRRLNPIESGQNYGAKEIAERVTDKMYDEKE